MNLTIALALACIWAVAANIAAVLPSRDRHRRAAVILIATGVPILGLVTWKGGLIWGLVALACGASLLRWPLRHLWRRLLRRA